jgi:glycolate oxidase FAD binding subunit
MKLPVPVFPPLPPALAALQARVRAAFDPACLFNPGRMRI